MSRRTAALHAERVRAAQRHRLLLWLEQFEAVARTPARTADEREAKAECLSRLEESAPRARP